MNVICSMQLELQFGLGDNIYSQKVKMGQRQKMCPNETIMRQLTDMCKEKLTKHLSSLT